MREGRAGGQRCGVWESLELLGARSGVGAVGGRDQTGPRAHFCGGICVPNSSSCDIDGHRASRRASRVARVARSGRAPVISFLERPRPSISQHAQFSKARHSTSRTPRVHDRRRRTDRLPPVDDIDRGSPPHSRSRAPLLPLTRVPRPQPSCLNHRKGTSQL